MITQRPTGTMMMPVKELLELPSIHQLLHPPGQRTTAHAVADIDRDTARYRAVRDWMAERGRPEYRSMSATPTSCSLPIRIWTRRCWPELGHDLGMSDLVERWPADSLVAIAQVAH
jgi:hypothetical protein